MRKAIPEYMHWKYEADKNLVKRTAFKWVILRPGGLTNEPGTGNAHIGRAHLGKGISVSDSASLRIWVINSVIKRQDVAKALALLVDRDDAAGLAIDLVGGDKPIDIGLDEFIKKGETDFLG